MYILFTITVHFRGNLFSLKSMDLSNTRNTAGVIKFCFIVITLFPSNNLINYYDFSFKDLNYRKGNNSFL